MFFPSCGRGHPPTFSGISSAPCTISPGCPSGGGCLPPTHLRPSRQRPLCLPPPADLTSPVPTLLLLPLLLCPQCFLIDLTAWKLLRFRSPEGLGWVHTPSPSGHTSTQLSPKYVAFLQPPLLSVSFPLPREFLFILGGSSPTPLSPSCLSGSQRAFRRPVAPGAAH